MKELSLGLDHADTVLGSAAVLCVAYGDSSSLMPLRQAPHQPDPTAGAVVYLPGSNAAEQTAYEVGVRSAAKSRRSEAGDIRGATYPGLAGQHKNPTDPRIQILKTHDPLHKTPQR